MKKLLIISLSFLMLNTFAQSSRFNSTDLAKNFKGYRVDDKHDTINGSFIQYLQFIMQTACSMKDINGKDLYGLTWDNTIYYEMENGLKWYSTKRTMLTPPADPKRIGAECFLHVMEAGPITLYDYNFYDQSKTPEVNEVKTYIQLPDKKIVDVSGMLLGFPKKMSEYVKDYPELAAKITAKEKGYGFTNINNVVREYNAWYMAKNPGFTIIEK
jgi:hypothetical protein